MSTRPDRQIHETTVLRLMQEPGDVRTYVAVGVSGFAYMVGPSFLGRDSYRSAAPARWPGRQVCDLSTQWPKEEFRQHGSERFGGYAVPLTFQHAE
jgi:hypothetical protein